jgi:mannitol/fructose-specific phosphotransferase system IIA component (Ntr-type)
MDLQLNKQFSSFKTWQECIYQAGQTLVEQNFIDSKYLDSIIESTIKYGPYYVLADQFAIAHSESNEKIIHQTSFSWNLIDKPVDFEDKKVKYLIILAAKTPDEHQQFLKEIAKIFMSSELKREFYKINDLTSLNDFVKKNFS